MERGCPVERAASFLSLAFIAKHDNMKKNNIRSKKMGRPTMPRSVFVMIALTIALMMTSCKNIVNSSSQGGETELLGGAIQGRELTLTGAVTTFAGSTTPGSTDGIGTAARFDMPAGITTDGTNLYITDSYNCMIRKVVIATREVTTVAGSTTSGSADGIGTAAQFYGPAGITTDGTNLYVVDSSNHMIRKVVIATGEVTTIAGSTTSGSADGIGTAARFYYPLGITTDGTNLYVVDSSNHMIRKVVIATGEVTTIAGSTTSGSADGIGTAARFYYPLGITTDGTNLYVVDSSNHMIRKVVIATGEVTTIAGSTTSGSADGIGTAARFYYPLGITTDGTNLYVVDGSNHMIRKVVIATGEVTTVAGSTTSGSVDGIGATARFNYPAGITTDGTDLYIADYLNNMIRHIE